MFADLFFLLCNNSVLFHNYPPNLPPNLSSYHFIQILLKCVKDFVNMLHSCAWSQLFYLR